VDAASGVVVGWVMVSSLRWCCRRHCRHASSVGSKEFQNIARWSHRGRDNGPCAPGAAGAAE